MTHHRLDAPPIVWTLPAQLCPSPPGAARTVILDIVGFGLLEEHKVREKRPGRDNVYDGHELLEERLGLRRCRRRRGHPGPGEGKCRRRAWASWSTLQCSHERGHRVVHLRGLRAHSSRGRCDRRGDGTGRRDAAARLLVYVSACAFAPHGETSRRGGAEKGVHELLLLLFRPDGGVWRGATEASSLKGGRGGGGGPSSAGGARARGSWRRSGHV